MANVLLSGTVDTLASGKSWLVEVDFNEQQPNLIAEENDTAFTTTVGNWYYQVDASWDSSGALVLYGNGAVGNYMRLSTDSVSRRILPMEKGKRYKISMRVKSTNEPIDLRLGIWELYHHQYAFAVAGDGNWYTIEKEFFYNDPTAFRDLVVFYDTFWDQNNEVYVDWIKLELLDVVPISDAGFQVVEFGEWSIGSEDLKPAYVEGFKTSLKIRPLGGGMTVGFREVLMDWMTALSRNVGRVRFYDNADPESPELFWRGKVDTSSVQIDLVENWISFDVVDFAIANSDIPCNTNPFGWTLANVNLTDNYREFDDLFLTYCNYMSPWIVQDTFYSTIVSDSTIRGWDLLNRVANLGGWDNSGTIVKFGFFADRYFSSAYESPYASTLGELLNDVAYAFQVKIIPWVGGQVLVKAVYDVGGTEVELADSDMTSVEQGILDLEQRGAKINVIGTQTTLSPTPYTNFQITDYVPSETACVDGTGQVRKFVEDSNLMFLSDWVNNTDANSMVADLVTRSVTSGVVTQSYCVNPGTYYKPTRFHAVYYDNGVETSVGWVTFLELHKALLSLGFLKQRKFIKVSMTGTLFDISKIYKVSWDTDSRYKIQSQVIDWVNNETELYLIEV